MNIRIYGECKYDKKVIKDFVEYVTNKFNFPKTTIIIRFINPNELEGQDSKDLRTFQAWMQQDKRRKFTITLSTTLRSLKGVLLCLGHELVHAKQYLTGELVDIDDDTIKYKGKLYKDWKYGEGYWFAPFELEAYGYEQALYETFIDLSSNR